jgi:hypothetical protein
MEQGHGEGLSEGMENPYSVSSRSVRQIKSTYGLWSTVGLSLLLSVSFLVSTLAADRLPKDPNHLLQFPLRLYTLPFTLPGMLLVHLGYPSYVVYVGAFWSSFIFSLVTVSVLRRVVRTGSSEAAGQKT